MKTATFYTESMAARMRKNAGEPWRPANSLEGELFDEQMCLHCRRQADCDIPLTAMLFGESEPEYPPQWRIAKNGQPTCTAFQAVAMEGGGNG